MIQCEILNELISIDLSIAAFVAKSVELTRKRKVGNPFAEDILQGKFAFSRRGTNHKLIFVTYISKGPKLTPKVNKRF